MRIAASCLAAVAIAFHMAAAPQNSKPREPDPDEQRKIQEKEQEKENERNKDPYKREGVPNVTLVQGKVLMAGAGKPPTRVPVRLVCDRAVKQTETDLNGAFLISVTWSPGAALMPPGVSMEGPLSNCVLQAALPGFRSRSVSVDTFGGGRHAHHILVLNPIERVEGYTFSASTLLAPKAAQRNAEKGEEALRKNDAAAAEREFRKAVEAYPKFAVAWYGLGRSLAAQGKAADAKMAYERSIEADPKYLNPYQQLAQMAVNEKRWEDVAALTGAIIRLNPFFSANTYFFSAMANAQSGRWELAEAHAREALKLDEQHELPKAHHMLGHILAERGSVTEAAEQFRLYLRQAPAAPDAEAVRQRLAELERRSIH